MSNITQFLGNIDYDWKKPQTYLVMVPALSFLIEKIQLAKVLPLPADNDQKNRQFAKICAWHLRGSLVQLTACIVAKQVFHVSSPILSAIYLVSSAEALYTALKALTNRCTINEYYPNGKIKKSHTSIPNLFSPY